MPDTGRRAWAAHCTGKTLGIFGYGRIGRVVADYGVAFGMPVQVWGREASREAAARRRAHGRREQGGVLLGCDVISLHMRLVEATQGIVTAGDLDADEADGAAGEHQPGGADRAGGAGGGSAAGRPGMAAVDVYEHEPAGAEEPLLGLENALCTPHIGYVTREEWELQFSDVFNQINAFADGSPLNMVNPEAWQAG